MYRDKWRDLDGLEAHVRAESVGPGPGFGLQASRMTPVQAPVLTPPLVLLSCHWSCASLAGQGGRPVTSNTRVQPELGALLE